MGPGLGRGFAAATSMVRAPSHHHSAPQPPAISLLHDLMRPPRHLSILRQLSDYPRLLHAAPLPWYPPPPVVVPYGGYRHPSFLLLAPARGAYSRPSRLESRQSTRCRLTRRTGARARRKPAISRRTRSVRDRRDAISPISIRTSGRAVVGSH